MKKLKYIPIAVCGMLVLQSCFKDDKDLFSVPASERLEARMNQTQDSLTASPYGWVMDYYPDQTKTSGGYTYVMEFKEDSHASVGYELAKPDERKESIYEMVADEGPVLIFNTYNEYMHHFATPSSSDYQGLGGDYEFIIMDIQPGYIKTKGKKSKNIMTMYRLDIPSEEYLTQRTETEKWITNPIVKLTGGNNSLKFTQVINKHVYTQEDKTKQPFVFTNKGLRLMRPITIDNVQVQNFVLSENKDHLVSTTNDHIIMKGELVSWMLENTANRSKKYNISRSKVGGGIEMLYDAFIESLKKENKRTLLNFAFLHNSNDYALYIQVKQGSTKYSAYYYFDVIQQEQEETIKLKYKGLGENISSENPNAEAFLNNELKALFGYIGNQVFTVSSAKGSLNADQLKWGNNDTWIEFTVAGK